MKKLIKKLLNKGLVPQNSYYTGVKKKPNKNNSLNLRRGIVTLQQSGWNTDPSRKSPSP